MRGDRVVAGELGGDVLGRFSGNKFGLILKNCTIDDMNVAAERFLAGIALGQAFLKALGEKRGIGRYADIVGRERVIAGVDCGFGTAVRTDPIVADSIVWAKLKSLSEGATIASSRLWGSKAA